MKEITLGRLIDAEDVIKASAGGWTGKLVTAITSDSREVIPGSVFFALNGSQTSGARFITESVARGAVAVVTDVEDTYYRALAEFVLLVPEARKTFALASRQYFNAPDDKMNIVGITGTNGKTSVAWIISEAFALLEKRPALYLGTLGARLVSEEQQNRSGQIVTLSWEDGKNTTPGIHQLWSILDWAQAQGAGLVALEVSSHSLEQERVYGLQFDVAAFTNLSRDHMDYHLTEENYGKAKEKLFKDLLVPGEKEGRSAVLNTDDQWGQAIYERLVDLPEGCRRLSVSEKINQADVHLVSAKLDQEETVLEVDFGGNRLVFGTRLIGAFNVSNILLASSCLWALGYQPQDVCSALGKVSSAPGRMQVVYRGEFTVVVDYAHTPDALERVQASLRPFCRGKLITVFGCGGDRDRGKRPMMAEIVSRYAQIGIVTSDNPRFEDPLAIIAEILAGFPCPSPKTSDFRWLSMPDRYQAVASAISLAEPGDLVLVAGKGHELYQEISGVKQPFSDVETVKRILNLQ